MHCQINQEILNTSKNKHSNWKVQFVDFGRKSWTLDSGCWSLNPGRWTLDAGHWTLDAERQTVDINNLKFKTVQSFGNNGAISMTSFLNSTLIKIFAYFSHENLSTVYSFQATLSSHLKISKTRGLQIMWRGKVDLK